ncbi:MAG: SURF1 family protein, partial [Rickettsiales bacterium]
MSKAERPTTTCGPFIFYKPKAVAVISTVLLVGMCLCLGIWQLQRLHWKEGLVAQLEENSAAQPMIKAHLPDNLDDLVNEPFRFISLPGEFKHEHEFHIAGRYRNGQVGYNIITPFEVADDGRQLLVNRGWVPLDKKAPEDRKEDPRFDGLVFMSGVIYVPEGNGRFLPDHDLKDNVWFWYDIPKMEEVAGIDLPPV